MQGDPAGRWGALAVLACATFLAMTTWFSASAVLPQLRGEWRLSATASAWLTIAVQIGFVLGSLLSAMLNLPDVLSPRRLIFCGAFGAALANAGLYLCAGAAQAIPLRMATGAFLALVYPPSLKEMATWFRAGRGTALGVMVGALTLGSALPHLLNAVAPAGPGGVEWRTVILATSALTLLGGFIAEFAGREGPFPFPKAVFDPRQAALVFRNRGVRLASLGYFGHMWELYAMWTWFGVFLADVLAQAGMASPRPMASLGTFAAVGAGAAGCAFGGVLGDRWGRARTNALAMALSGSCALVIGWSGWPAWAVVALGILWGFWVVADSAQFSTMVTEYGEQSYVGTAVTLQLAIGFSLTVLTIWLVPLVRDAFGWHAALAMLAPGPVAGIAAMLMLERRKERL
jgi:MFS family permease